MAVSFIGIAAIIKLALNHLKLVLSVYSFTFLSPFLAFTLLTSNQNWLTNVFLCFILA